MRTYVSETGSKPTATWPSASSRAPLLAAGTVLASAVCVAIGVVAAGAGGGTGSPERGRALYLSSNCAACHAFSPSGVRPPDGTVAPDLDTALTRDAAGAGQPLGLFILESIVDPNAFAAAGFAAGTMPGYADRFTMQQLDDLVSFLSGRSFSSGVGSGSPDPASVCDRTPACRSDVGRWTRLGHLLATAVPGAKVFAAAGCLACHRYLGSGARGVRAPDLSGEGRRRRGTIWQTSYLTCPSCVITSTRMPRFANLGMVTRRQLAIFLEASKSAPRR